MESNDHDLLIKDINNNNETDEKKNSNHSHVIESFKKMTKNGPKYSDRNKIKDLIKLITEFTTEEDKLNKFPYLASEILIKSDKKIQDMIFLSEEEFNNLYNKENEKINNEPVKGIEMDLNIKIISKKFIDQLREDFDNKKEKIKTEKKEKKEIKEKRKFNIDKHNDILDTLFDFTKNENSLSNDALCGYFYNVISFNGKLFIRYIFIYFLY